MCEAHEAVDRLLLVHDARVAADDMLGDFARIPIAKATDLGTSAGFDRAVGVLAAQLRRAVGTADVNAIRDAMAVLDVDWANTTTQERRRLVTDAMRAAGRSTAIIPSQIRAPLGDAAESVVEATRSHVRRGQGLAIGASMNALDRRIVTHVAGSQGNFVRDEYGRRVDHFGEQARRIVADGLEQGLGRDDIASDLERAARRALVERAPFYWEVVASSFIARGRSFAQMSSYAEAGIDRYVFEAVLDERTTDICRLMHGRTFTVGSALERFDRVEQLEAPEDIKRVTPWVRQGRDEESGRTTLYVDRGNGRTPIAQVTRSAVGTRDDRGEFHSVATETEMEAAGLGLPALHALCRSTTLAVA